MVKVGAFAIDIYENSELNGHCISVCGGNPITGLTCDEARIMAGLSQKRLPTSKQWLAACDPDSFPQIRSIKPIEGAGFQNTWSMKVAATGEFAAKNMENYASSGCVDMIGNVWEWCDEVIDLVSSAAMPTTKMGYVSQTAAYKGIDYWPSVTVIKRPVESFGYFHFDWASEAMQAGIARGASCDDGDKAGPASLLLSVGRKQASPRIGFRCIR
jgi:formylglycine-generating enzyme required for sulfatase activity